MIFLRYNQIFLTYSCTHKRQFWCSSITFLYVVMSLLVCGLNTSSSNMQKHSKHIEKLTALGLASKEVNSDAIILSTAEKISTTQDTREYSEKYLNERSDSQRAFNRSLLHDYDPPLSLIFSGVYYLYNTTRKNSLIESINHPTSHLSLYSKGKLTLIVLTRPSSLPSLRLVSAQLTLENSFPMERHNLRLSGIEYSNINSAALQGSAHRSQIFLPLQSIPAKETNPLTQEYEKKSGTLFSQEPDRCVLSGSLKFASPLIKSRFVGFIGLSQDSEKLSDWGFNDYDFFIGGGTWNDFRLLAEKQQVSLHTDETALLNYTPSRSSHVPSLRSSHQFNKSVLEQNSSVEQVSKKEKNDIEELWRAVQTEKGTPLNAHDLIAKENYGFFVSSNCGVEMFVSFSEVNFYRLIRHVILFAIVFVIKCFFEFYFLIQQSRHTDAIPNSSSKVSFMSLGLHATVDCFECIVLFKEFLTTKFVSFVFILLTAFKMLFLSVVELHYMVIILKAHFPDADRVQEITRYLKLHAFGTGLLLILIFKFVTISSINILFLYGFWLPQIVFDVKQGNRHPLDISYIIGMSLCRLLFPLYLWGWPYSIFDGLFYKQVPGAPDYKLCVLLVLFTFSQAGVLLLQFRYGPRCFLPSFFFPNAYNYYRLKNVPDEFARSLEEGSCFECVICMADRSYVKKTMVVTPCNHFFHEACLLNWIEVKMECPTCRSPLPPFL